MNTLERIKNEVARRKLDATELAIMSALSYWKVYHTLAGHSSDDQVVARLAKVLGLNEAEEAA